MKIYTKTGDKGTSSLLGGTRVSKSNERLEAYGTTDELNSFIALLLSKITDKHPAFSLLRKSQSLLFEIGASLATEENKQHLYQPSLTEQDITDLESAMDQMTEGLPVQKYFILPAPQESVALAHVCRTVCRRAERSVIAIPEHTLLHPLLIPYLNRLSDYFFVLSRQLSKDTDTDEVYWIPDKK